MPSPHLFKDDARLLMAALHVLDDTPRRSVSVLSNYEINSYDLAAEISYRLRSAGYHPYDAVFIADATTSPYKP
jgi:hypothetical protein